MLVALALIVSGAGIYFLAVGYVLAGLIGLAISSFLVVAILRADGLLPHFKLKTLRVPVRETLAFTMPLLTTDLVNVLLFSSDAVLLGYFHGTGDVAAFRVIFPLATAPASPTSTAAPRSGSPSSASRSSRSASSQRAR
jgi:O-antigen/teichoic acid export membrane protein